MSITVKPRHMGFPGIAGIGLTHRLNPDMTAITDAQNIAGIAQNKTAEKQKAQRPDDICPNPFNHRYAIYIGPPRSSIISC